jgi:hypothetical protein
VRTIGRWVLGEGLGGVLTEQRDLPGRDAEEQDLTAASYQAKLLVLAQGLLAEHLDGYRVPGRPP